MFSDIKELENEIEQFRKNMSSSKELLDLLAAATDLIKNQERFITEQEDELRRLQSSLPKEIQSKNADFTKQSLNLLIETHEKHSNEVSEAFQSFVGRVQETEERIDKLPERYEAVAAKSQEDLAKSIRDANNEISAAFERFLCKVQEAETIIGKLPDKYETVSNSAQAELVKSLEAANSEMREAFSQFVCIVSKISSDNVANSSENQALIQQKLDEYQSENQKCCDSLKSYEQKAKEISSQIEGKYSAFLSKLEETNMDQIYKMCQSMRNDINVKLYLLMGGTAVAVVLGVLGLVLK